MRSKRHDWFMFMLVLPFAIVGVIILWIGARDIEAHKQQRLQVDSVQRVQDRPRHDPREDSLVTKEDSIHFYEDGY
ncbi:MAG: hypothetical protein IKW83_12085 [Muribaculaceae bacterium]|nr:hypothetical protein [Muribaculaceae bacterium]